MTTVLSILFVAAAMLLGFLLGRELARWWVSRREGGGP